jgi:microcin C transport system substrate-binding protein
MKPIVLVLALAVPAAAQTNPHWEEATLPAGLQWHTNDSDPTYADPGARKGGTLRTFELSFPLSLRTVGPDSNDSFRTFLLANQMPLTMFHPNTRKPIPALATHWAYGDDQKTIYYKLNPKAVWSDGKPVTAMDYAFALEMMRSKHIVAPWYNEYYSTKYDKILVIDDRTLAIRGTERRSRNDMHYYYDILPRPRHFHKLDENWVRDFNWKVEPNTGPYQISKVEKGKEIVFERKKGWWGSELRFWKNRHNVDRIVATVIRDQNIAFEHFKKAQLDGFPVTMPQFWHEKAKGDIFDKGYVHKLWFYTDRPLPDYGMWLNQDVALFKDKDVRLGFQHAMNVEKVLKSVLRGDYERLNSGSEGYGKATDKTLRARPFDLTKADEHLSKAGWGTRGPDGIRVKDGKRLSVRVTYGAATHTDRLVVIKEEAKKAGIELTLQLLDSAAAFKTMLEKKHEIAYSGWGAQDKPEYWGQYHSKNAHKPQTNNFSNTDDPELDKLIDDWRAEFDEDEQARLSRAIERRVWEGAAYIPTWKVPYFRIAYWRWLKWPTPPATKTSDDPVTYAMKESDAWDGLYWIDEDAKKETLAAMKEGRTFPPVTSVDKTYKAD